MLARNVIAERRVIPRRTESLVTSHVVEAVIVILTRHLGQAHPLDADLGGPTTARVGIRHGIRLHVGLHILSDIRRAHVFIDSIVGSVVRRIN